MEWAQGGGHRLHRQTRSQAGGGGAEFRLRWQQAKGPVRGWVGDGTTAVLAVCGARAPRSKFWGYDSWGGGGGGASPVSFYV